MHHDGDRPQRGALRALGRAIDGGVMLIRPDLSLEFASDGALRLLLPDEPVDLAAAVSRLYGCLPEP